MHIFVFTPNAELLLNQSLIFSRLNEPNSLLLRHVLQTPGHIGGSPLNLFWFISLYCSWMQYFRCGLKCWIPPKSDCPNTFLIHLVCPDHNVLSWYESTAGLLAEVKINNIDCSHHPQKLVFTTENHHWVTEHLVSSHWLFSVTSSFI